MIIEHLHIEETDGMLDNTNKSGYMIMNDIFKQMQYEDVMLHNASWVNGFAKVSWTKAL